MTTPNESYIRQLVEAGWQGATSTRTSAMLAPAALGAGIGALSATLRRRNRKALAVIIGGALGLGAGAATVALHGAVRRINTTRDMHWLEKNPICYG